MKSPLRLSDRICSGILALSLSAGTFGGMVGCGDKTAAPAPSSEVASEAKPSSSAVASTSAAALPAPAAVPAGVPTLVAGVPEKATVVAYLPGFEVLGPQKAMMEAALPSVLAEVSKETGISTDTLKSVIEAFDGLTIFASGSAKEWESSMPAQGFPVAAMVQLKDEKPFLDIAQKLEKTGENRFKYTKDQSTFFVAWLADKKIAVVATAEPALQSTLDTIEGKGRSFASTELAKNVLGARGFAIADLAAIIGDTSTFDAGSMVSVAGFGSDTASEATLVYRQYGARVPRLSSVMAPTSHEAIGALPPGPMMALDLSLARTDKGLTGFFGEIARATGSDPIPQLNAVLGGIALDVPKIDAALGDSLCLGLYTDATNALEVQSKIGVVATLSMREDATAKGLFQLAKASEPKDVKFGDDRVDFEKDGNSGSIELGKGFVRVVFGSKATAAALRKDIAAGKTMGADPQYAALVKGTTPSVLRMFTDFAKVAKLSPQPGSLGALPPAGFSDVVLVPSDKGVDVQVKQGVAMVAVLGTMSALAVFGVQRYIQQAKAAQPLPH